MTTISIEKSIGTNIFTCDPQNRAVVVIEEDEMGNETIYLMGLSLSSRLELEFHIN